MELRQLRYFVAVAQHEHFGRAAGALHMAQPALSRAVRQFEAELGVPLFTRSTRHVALTAAGQTLLADAQDLLRRAETARIKVRSTHEGRMGRVRIGCTGSASYGYLPGLARALTAELPGLELDIDTEMLTPAQERALLDGRMDLGVLRLPVSTDDLQWVVVENSPLILALPVNHPLAQRTDLDLRDIIGEPFIGYGTTSGSVAGAAALRACQEAGFTPRTVREVGETATLLALVAAGLGVALVPSEAQAMSLEGVRFREVSGTPSVDLAVAWRRHDRPAPVLPVLRALARTGLIPADPLTAAPQATAPEGLEA